MSLHSLESSSISKKMSKITVLVAVYNAEPFLRQCLDSLASQTLRDVQVVCIDDCSTDGSLSVLNQYAACDERFCVIHLSENHGQAYARNEGLKVATGQYITTLDADDWFSTDALQQAVSVMEQHPMTDAVLFDLRLSYPDGTDKAYSWHYPTDGIETNSDGSFKMMTGRQAFLASLTWQIHGTYVAKRALFEQYPFDTSLHSYSDDNATRLQYRASREVRCCPGKYFYRQHDNSVTHKPSVNRMDWMGAMTILRSQLSKLRESEDVLRTVELQRWLIIVDSGWFLYRNRHVFNCQQRRYCMDRIREEWADTNTSLLPLRKKLRPGFFPFRGCWPMFRLQEWLLFTMKRLLRRP